MPVPYWRLSFFYFSYFAALGCFISYWGLYLRAKGFSAVEIGQLSALLLAMKLVSPNIWGWLADRYRKSLRIVRWSSFLTALAFAGFLKAHDYSEFVLISLAYGFFWNASLPIYEAMTLAHLQADSHRYSQVRLWGSVGFILSVTTLGQWLDYHPIHYLPLVALGLFLLWWFSTLLTPDCQELSAPTTRSNANEYGNKPALFAFLAIYVLIQIAHAPYYVFYSIYLKEHGYSTTMTGLLWSSGVVAEIVLFLAMKYLLGRFTLRRILLISLLFSVVRWLLIGNFVDNVALVVLAQLLHAASFGGTHIAGIHFMHRFFDARHQGKGQALYHSVSFGLGGMLGSLLSGQYWEVLGPHLIYSIAAACCGLAYVMAHCWIERGEEDEPTGKLETFSSQETPKKLAPRSHEQ